MLQRRFWLPLTLQALLILAIPVQAIYTQITGRSVILQTNLPDAYTPFRTYYLALTYDISSLERLDDLPGWREIATKTNPDPTRSASLFDQTVPLYVILQAPEGNNRSPQPWQPVAVQRDRPSTLPANQIALRGTYQGETILYGVETYYIPEDAQTEIINQLQQISLPRQNAPVWVEIKVNSDGQAFPVQLWIGDRSYRY